MFRDGIHGQGRVAHALTAEILESGPWIFVQGFKVEVYEEYLGPGEWEPVFGSPGNLSCVEHYIFSNETHDSISSCKVMALQNVKSKLVVAIVDAETKEASFSEFDESDNAQARFQMDSSDWLHEFANEYYGY